jgi:hypothetical protein
VSNCYSGVVSIHGCMTSPGMEELEQMLCRETASFRSHRDEPNQRWKYRKEPEARGVIEINEVDSVLDIDSGDLYISKRSRRAMVSAAVWRNFNGWNFRN